MSFEFLRYLIKPRLENNMVAKRLQLLRTKLGLIRLWTTNI
uniref:Uncharacterized protein n=1 Tax=Musa acuminata subsp. malaccensis TaxID=214687 RepID=A0A804U5R1_MUSAM